MSESSTPPPRYGPPSRGITPRDVEVAADALLRAGERPTIEKIREKIGRGSPNTINPLLDAWWKRLASRLDAGPAALHRLPESVAHVAEALWMQALDQGRRRAVQELSREARSAAHTKEDLEVRSHVLTLREGELEARLQVRERDVEELRLQLQTLSLTRRKDQATIESQTRRIASLEDELLARRHTPVRPARKPPAPRKRNAKQKPQRAAKLPRPPATKRRKIAPRKRTATQTRRR